MVEPLRYPTLVHGLLPFKKYSKNFFPLCAAGIALALFGGVQKHVMDKNKVPVRGDIHVMIVGKFQYEQPCEGASFISFYITASSVMHLIHWTLQICVLLYGYLQRSQDFMLK